MPLRLVPEVLDAVDVPPAIGHQLLVVVDPLVVVFEVVAPVIVAFEVGANVVAVVDELVSGTVPVQPARSSAATATRARVRMVEAWPSLYLVDAVAG